MKMKQQNKNKTSTTEQQNADQEKNRKEEGRGGDERVTPSNSFLLFGIRAEPLGRRGEGKHWFSAPVVGGGHALCGHEEGRMYMHTDVDIGAGGRGDAVASLD